MKLNSSLTILVTGASGGLGTYISNQLAEYGMNLALLGVTEAEVAELQDEFKNHKADTLFLLADLRIDSERRRVINEVMDKFGKIDILVNNAGIEFTSPYHELTEDDINSVIDLNLVAPMILSRLVIPHMLNQGSGHIVNMSSLAGKASPAYQEAYAATKSGLIAFTTSIRETYRGQGISASAICPGFVEAGIYTRLKESSGVSAPALLGTSKPEKVSSAVIKAIEKDLPQIIINPLPVKPLLVISEISPRLGAWMVRMIGAHKFFKTAYQAKKAND